ncbi:hypothetical protein [Bacillus safensis]|uniref:Uncharacterized protein n=1 Tax=Bacillus safensis TaxID=561879 RepID=A0A1L6ZPC1_BACIA|nr:hypothetical protein [Bacillus safensis]APT48359.1 hypothetical protein BSA145_21075 [Bacillus safensis]
MKFYKWHEIAGTELPQYTFIPSDLIRLTDQEVFNVNQYVQEGWYIDRQNTNGEELYEPLYRRKIEVSE